MHHSLLVEPDFDVEGLFASGGQQMKDYVSSARLQLSWVAKTTGREYFNL
jgi:hypothetical protein